MTDTATDIGGLEEAKEAIVARGRERGFVTSEDLLEGLPVDDLTPEQVEEFLTQIEEHLRGEGIEVIEVPGEDLEGELKAAVRDDDVLKAPTNDPVRMYLKEIGKVPLLNAAQEVDLARRIEAGEFSTELFRLTDDGAKVDQKKLRRVVEAVVEIREHQEDKFGKVEGIGRERISRVYKPRTREDLFGFLHRVERDGQLAKKKLIEANLRLVVSIARRFNHGRLPLADLIQEGNIGLMKAVERYDYRRGFRFSTYASWWIRHAISRALADKGRAVRLPVHMIDAYHRIAKSQRELQSKLERVPSTQEIAAATGIEAEKLEKMKTFLSETPVSLDRPISDEDGRRLIDVLVDPNEGPAVPDQMASTETQSEMLKFLSSLKPIEADILRKRFGLVNDRERTLKEIGDEYRLSRERVRQLQEQALVKMRRAMAKRESV